VFGRHFSKKEPSFVPKARNKKNEFKRLTGENRIGRARGVGISPKSLHVLSSFTTGIYRC
jgi:hypothetical protein